MSEAPSSPDFEEIIEERIEKCGELLVEINEYGIEQGSEPEIFQQLDGYYEALDQTTKACLSNRFRTPELYNWLRYIFRVIAKERGYHHKIERETSIDTKTEDSIINTYRWFKLYSTVVLNEEVDFPTSPTIENLATYRDEEITHPTELPSVDRDADPMLLSVLLLIWTSLEEVFRTWVIILELDRDTLEGREHVLSDQAEFHIGFVARLLEDHGYVTSFQNGENGDSIRISPEQFEFFVKEGDIVIVETTTNDWGNPIPDTSDGEGIRKYPTEGSP